MLWAKIDKIFDFCLYLPYSLPFTNLTLFILELRCRRTARKLPSSTQTFARISLKKMSFRPISPLLFRPYLYEEIISKASVWVSDVVKWKIFHPYSLDKKKTKSRSSRPARFFLLFLLATHFCMTVFHAWKVSDQFEWVCISESV